MLLKVCDTETIRAPAQHRDTVENISACQLMMKFNFTFPLKAKVSFHSLLSSNSLEVGSQRGAGILRAAHHRASHLGPEHLRAV